MKKCMVALLNMDDGSIHLASDTHHYLKRQKHRIMAQRA